MSSRQIDVLAEILWTLRVNHIENEEIKLSLEEMKEFNCTEFTIGDIVRSGFIRNYLINKIKLGIGMQP